MVGLQSVRFGSRLWMEKYSEEFVHCPGVVVSNVASRGSSVVVINVEFIVFPS